MEGNSTEGNGFRFKLVIMQCQRNYLFALCLLLAPMILKGVNAQQLFTKENTFVTAMWKANLSSGVFRKSIEDQGFARISTHGSYSSLCSDWTIKVASQKECIALNPYPMVAVSLRSLGRPVKGNLAKSAALLGLKGSAAIPNTKALDCLLIMSEYNPGEVTAAKLFLEEGKDKAYLSLGILALSTLTLLPKQPENRFQRIPETALLREIVYFDEKKHLPFDRLARIK